MNHRKQNVPKAEKRQATEASALAIAASVRASNLLASSGSEQESGQILHQMNSSKISPLCFDTGSGHDPSECAEPFSPLSNASDDESLNSSSQIMKVKLEIDESDYPDGDVSTVLNTSGSKRKQFNPSKVINNDDVELKDLQ